MSGLRVEAGKERRYLYVQVELQPKSTSLLSTTIVTTSDDVSTGHDNGTPYAFTVRNDQGVASTQNVTFQPLACDTAGLGSQVVSCFVPLSDAVDEKASYTLEVARAGQVLANLPLAIAPPTVRFANAPAARKVATGRQDVTWTLDAQDSDASASLWYSPDGTSWYALAVGSRSDTLSVDFDTLPAGTSAVLRLTGTTGLGTSSVDSDPFEVAEPAAAVKIVDPADETMVAPGRPLRVSAVALLGDGTMITDPEVYRWSSDLDGELGVGDRRNLILSTSGRHTIQADVKVADTVLSATCTVEVRRDRTRLLCVADKDNAVGNHVSLTAPELDGRPDAIVLVTPIWNPPPSNGVYCESTVLIAFDGKQWQVGTGDGADLPIGAAFVVDVLDPGPTALVTTLDADRATPQYPPALSREVQGTLAMTTLRAAALPGAAIVGRLTAVSPKSVAAPEHLVNVELLRPGAETFVHVTSSDTVSGNSSRLEHPALNGKADALFQVGALPGTAAAGLAIGVWYDGAAWNIFRQDRQEMDQGASFVVIV